MNEYLSVAQGSDSEWQPAAEILSGANDGAESADSEFDPAGKQDSCQ